MQGAALNYRRLLDYKAGREEKGIGLTTDQIRQIQRLYDKLKKQVERCRREADKAKGALGQLTAQLKKEFGCSTVEEAEKLLASLARDEERLEKEFDKVVKNFEAKWKDVLEEQ